MATQFSDTIRRARTRSIRPAARNSGFYSAVGKRIFDVTLVLLAAPFVLPLVLMLALVAVMQGQSAFFLQDRVGRGGRTYKMWKLRTMIPNAEEHLQSYLDQNPEAAREWALTQKLKHDPRITPFGHFLRKSSLDELPQLWNVLKGEMSLVGPRPMMPSQRDMYSGRAYYTQRPGITGNWQVSERNESAFADRARFDADYVANLSLKNDVSLLLATIRVVIKATGY